MPVEPVPSPAVEPRFRRRLRAGAPRLLFAVVGLAAIAWTGERFVAEVRTRLRYRGWHLEDRRPPLSHEASPAAWRPYSPEVARLERLLERADPHLADARVVVLEVAGVWDFGIVHRHIGWAQILRPGIVFLQPSSEWRELGATHWIKVGHGGMRSNRLKRLFRGASGSLFRIR